MATEDQIRHYARLLWEKAGKPEGRSEEFWHAAEVELNSESDSPDAPTEDAQPNQTRCPAENRPAAPLADGQAALLSHCSRDYFSG
jgi:hypothetical protein